MRIRLDALIKPVDPVVAMHPSSREADAAVAALRRAGYGDRMLSVVGQTGPSVDLAGFRPSHAGGAPHWAASGTGLGLLWALFTLAVVVLHLSGDAAFLALATLGALALALQAAVMAQVVAPERRMLRTRASSLLPTPTRTGAPTWHYLVVVHGSRSEVALARDILAAQ